MADGNQTSKRLTLQDPVGKDVLDKLAELEMSDAQSALNLMDLVQEKVHLVAVGRRIREEKNKIFQKILMERGLPPVASVTIDKDTGRLTLNEPQVMPPSPTPSVGQA